MKKEILLLIVLISSGFLIYSLIPTPTNISKNTENNRENVNIESQNKIRKKIEEVNYKNPNMLTKELLKTIM